MGYCVAILLCSAFAFELCCRASARRFLPYALRLSCAMMQDFFKRKHIAHLQRSPHAFQWFSLLCRCCSCARHQRAMHPTLTYETKQNIRTHCSATPSPFRVGRIPTFDSYHQPGASPAAAKPPALVRCTFTARHASFLRSNAVTVPPHDHHLSEILPQARRFISNRLIPTRHSLAIQSSVIPADAACARRFTTLKSP